MTATDQEIRDEMRRLLAELDLKRLAKERREELLGAVRALRWVLGKGPTPSSRPVGAV